MPLFSASDTKAWESTYKRKPAVVACSDFGLVGVDEDLGMAQWPATAIAGDNPVLCPAHRLLVDKFNGGVRLRLEVLLATKHSP